MPLHSWRYKADAEGVRRIGPTAHDFRAAFGLGSDEKTVATVDADGVALAAIQGLNAKLEARIADHAREIAGLRAQHAAEMAELRHAIDLLLARVATVGRSP